MPRLQRQIGERKTWAAVSTHDGEEMIAAEVHAMLAAAPSGLLTIIVPRHPERADALIGGRSPASACASCGAATASRSAAETDILLGDTIGEMGLYLRLTEIAFVGRSLTSRGRPEPARAGDARHRRARRPQRPEFSRQPISG